MTLKSSLPLRQRLGPGARRRRALKRERRGTAGLGLLLATPVATAPPKASRKPWVLKRLREAAQLTVAKWVAKVLTLKSDLAARAGSNPRCPRDRERMRPIKGAAHAWRCQWCGREWEFTGIVEGERAFVSYVVPPKQETTT